MRPTQKTVMPFGSQAGRDQVWGLIQDALDKTSLLQPLVVDITLSESGKCVVHVLSESFETALVESCEQITEAVRGPLSPLTADQKNAISTFKLWLPSQVCSV